LGVGIISLYLSFIVEEFIAYIAKTEHTELGLMEATGMTNRFAAIGVKAAAVVGAVVATHLITIILAVTIF
jgi:hypothetical protein